MDKKRNLNLIRNKWPWSLPFPPTIYRKRSLNKIFFIFYGLMIYLNIFKYHLKNWSPWERSVFFSLENYFVFLRKCWSVDCFPSSLFVMFLLQVLQCHFSRILCKRYWGIWWPRNLSCKSWKKFCDRSPWSIDVWNAGNKEI